jgi:polysaccharide deacetylase family protein (PEP-CTERM system associated)
VVIAERLFFSAFQKQVFARVNKPTRALSVTFDLEDHRQSHAGSKRYLANTARILDFLDKNTIRATIFVVGNIIPECRDVLRRASAAGHELALHSVTHTPLTQTSRATLGAKLADARASLEDVSGCAVTGFRAPVFSLTPATVWITELLVEAGFRYSSSVLPAAHPMYGYPGAPRGTFRWPSGLVEFPVPIGRIGPTSLPFLGGIYLRYLPLPIIIKLVRRLEASVVPWTYLHPYDIDSSEAYYRFPGTSAVQSVLLWRRRRATLARLKRLLENAAVSTGGTLAEHLATSAALDLPQFTVNN